MKAQSLLALLLCLTTGALYYSYSSYATATQREFYPARKSPRVYRNPRVDDERLPGELVEHYFYCQKEELDRGSSFGKGAAFGGTVGATLGGITKGGRGAGIGLGLGMLAGGLIGLSQSSRKYCYWVPVDPEYANDPALWKSATRREMRQHREGDRRFIMLLPNIPR